MLAALEGRIARKLNVFTSKVQYVEFSTSNYRLTTRQIPLPPELVDVADEEPRARISGRIRAPLCALKALLQGQACQGRAAGPGHFQQNVPEIANVLRLDLPQGNRPMQLFEQAHRISVLLWSTGCLELLLSHPH